jgi:hypothetical protein
MDDGATACEESPWQFGPDTRELLMADTDAVPWGTVAAVAGGLLAAAVVVRGVVGVARIAFGEARFRASDPDTWLKWVR